MRPANTTRPSRLLRVREFGEKTAKKPASKSGKSRKSRFIAPFYFKEEEQAAIRDMLAEAGIGDAEGQTLFITAAEYEVGSLQLAMKDEPSLKPVPSPRKRSPAETELAEMAVSTQRLLDVFANTNADARRLLGERLSESDLFRRTHGDAYFELIEQELRRIGDACLQCAPETQSAAPAYSEHARRFVVQLARIFGECLEVTMDSESRRDIFRRILCIIRDDAQIRIPCDAETVDGLLNPPA